MFESFDGEASGTIVFGDGDDVPEDEQSESNPCNDQTEIVKYEYEGGEFQAESESADAQQAVVAGWLPTSSTPVLVGVCALGLVVLSLRSTRRNP